LGPPEDILREYFSTMVSFLRSEGSEVPVENARLMISLSDRATKLKPSPTLAVTALFKQMLREGRDVIGFGAGEPDFDTPDGIKEAAITALRDGKTKYEPAPGSPDARQAVADDYSKRYGAPLSSNNVLISCGGKHSLFLAFQSLFNPGDELLLPAPYWVSYPEQVKLAGGTTKTIRGLVDNGFKITPEQLKEAVTPKSKALLLNSPGNPTGITYTPEELTALVDVAMEAGLFIISDEIYDRLLYNGQKTKSLLSFPEEVRKRSIVINGLSKAFSMTGWRIGFTVAEPHIIKAMGSLQGQMTSNICAFAMAAIKTALENHEPDVEAMRVQFEKRGALMHQLVSDIPDVKCPVPTGAFYVFPDVSAYFGKKDPTGKVLNSAQELATSLLENSGVAVVPGEGFEAPEHVRLSFATDPDSIKNGIGRIREFLLALT
jgi:aspartate aminotransferase